VLARQYGAIGTEIASIDKSIMALHRGSEASRRLAEIPGIGPIGATALVAEIGDWKTFSSGRSVAAWIGLVPKQHTTGGKDRLGSITKQGNRYLRWLLVVGAMAVIRYARKHGTQARPWLGRLMSAAPRKWRPWRSPTRWRGWPGPSWSGARDTRSRNCCWRHDARRQIDRQHQLARA